MDRVINNSTKIDELLQKETWLEFLISISGKVRQQLVDRAARERGCGHRFHTVAGEAGGGAHGDGCAARAPPLRRAARAPRSTPAALQR